MTNKMITCPYNEAHRMKESRFATHIANCRLDHLNDEKFICPFNATHVLPMLEKCYHLSICADRAPLDRQLMADAMGRNNPFHRNTSIPSYTESQITTSDEIWDEDPNPVSRIGSKPPPPYAIIEPPALAKPKERRRLYQELHQMPAEMERMAAKNNLPSKESSPIKRQPKAPSQVETKKQQEFQNLGLGRGRPAQPNRIAANIFPPTTSQEPRVNANNYSAALTSGMGNLGLGRGFSSASAANNQLDDDQFPALGCGRGITKPVKKGERQPGSWH